HSENEALGRNSQEFRFEFAYVDGGVLDQSSDFIKQGVDFGALADGGAQAIGLIMQLAQDVGAAAFEARHDAPLLQQYRFVLVGRGDLEYALAHEAVALGVAVGREAQRLHWNDILAPQRNKTVSRPNEAYA